MDKIFGPLKSWGDVMAVVGIAWIIMAFEQKRNLYALIGCLLFTVGLRWFIEYKIEASKGDSVDE